MTDTAASATANPEPSDVYVGPRPFRTGQKLYGRDREARQLVSLLISQRLVLLHSPSGAGKTSLIHAKVVPALQKRRFDIPTYETPAAAVPQPVVIRVNREPERDDPPGANRYVLSALLSLELHRPEAERRAAAELAALTIDGYLEQEFPHASLDAGEETPTGQTFRPLLLLLDQFEELLTLDPTDQAAKRVFLKQLATALGNEGRWALFSIREDFRGALEPYLSTIPTGLAASYHLDLLHAEIAVEAIKEPASEAGVTYEEGVVESLIEDLREVRVQGASGAFEMKAGPYVEPVHLQVVCQSLWQMKGDAQEIRHEHLEQLSHGKGTGVDEVLAAYYADRVRHAAAEGGVAERQVREWFGKQLIGAQKVRRPVLVNDAIDAGMTPECLEVLDKAFLIRRETRSGAQWYELAHDRLMTPVVSDNETWRANNLSGFQTQAELWNDRGRPDYLLLSGDPLEEAESAASQDDGAVTQTEREFLAESAQVQRQVLAEQRHARQKRRNGFLAIAVLVLSAMTFWAVRQTFAAKRQTEVAVEATERAQEAKNRAEWAAYSGFVAQAQEAWEEGYLRLAREHLKQCDPKYRGWEYDYLNSQMEQVQRTTFFGHDASVTGVAFSPDGNKVASGSVDMTLRIWDVETRKTEKEFNAKNWIRSISYSDDGTRIACGMYDGLTLVWDLLGDPATGPMMSLGAIASGDNVSAVAFGSGDRKDNIVSGYTDGRVCLWDVSKGKQQARVTLGRHNDSVTSVEFGPQGRWVASSGEDGVINILAVDGNEQEEPLRTLHGVGVPVNTIAVIAIDERHWIASGGEDGAIRLWDVSDLQSETNNPAASYQWDQPFDHRITAMAFSAVESEVLLIAGSRDGKVLELQLDLEGDASMAPAEGGLHGNPHRGVISEIAYRPNRPLASRMAISGGVDCLLRISDGTSGSKSSNIVEPDLIWQATLNPRGDQIASGNAEDEIHLYDWPRGEPAPDAPGKSMELVRVGSVDQVWSVAYNRTGDRLASGGTDRRLKIWDTKSRNLIGSYVGHKSPINFVRYSHDGRWIASCDEGIPEGANGEEASGGVIMIWEAADPEKPPYRVLAGHTDSVTSVAFSRDDTTLISSSADGTLKVWDLSGQALSPTHTLKPPSSTNTPTAIHTVNFAHAKEWFASGGEDNAVTLWDAKTFEPVRQFRGHAAWVTSVAFDADDNRLASGSQDSTIKLWELESGQDVMTLAEHLDTVWSVEFSPDGRRLVSASEDRTIKVWEALEPKQYR